ncbi:alpha/beta hydrolase family esterase [Thauera sp. WH-1]|uniref:extracellular catalytic domain type 1 short-chain-length polyhydroxyalkanoate depolymerase n=1 Tax=Thauera sp. WH-1 TaxID=3398230 RepID=UPI0039FD18A0
MSRRRSSAALTRALQKVTRSMLRAGQRAAGDMMRRSAKAVAHHRAPSAGKGDWIAGQAVGPAGLRRFHLFRPQGVGKAERLPLLVMLHGCGQTASQFGQSTRMNPVAVRERFLVLYPEQERSANPQGCWNWYDTRSRHADAEAATLMQAIEQVCLLYPVDAEAVAVAGFSAGASMAALLAVRYPTRFRAVAMHAGVPPGRAQSAAGALAAMSGRRHEAGAPLPDNLPPLLVIHGRDDHVVAARNGRDAVEDWAQAVGARAAAPRRVQRGQRLAMTVSDYRCGRRLRARLCEVEGLGHAWSGGDGGQLFSDPRGPDAARLIWRFVAERLREGRPASP